MCVNILIGLGVLVVAVFSVFCFVCVGALLFAWYEVVQAKKIVKYGASEGVKE